MIIFNKTNVGQNYLPNSLYLRYFANIFNKKAFIINSDFLQNLFTKFGI